jgi:hypothetical protein
MYGIIVSFISPGHDLLQSMILEYSSIIHKNLPVVMHQKEYAALQQRNIILPQAAEINIAL